MTNVTANGDSLSQLDALYTQSGAPGVPAQVLGTFDLNTNGNFEFISAPPIPEPSTIGLAGAGSIFRSAWLLWRGFATKKSFTEDHSTAATTDDQKETANEHELDGSIRVHWCPFVVRKFFAKLCELQPQ